MSHRRLALLTVLSFTLFSLFVALPGFAESHVRIVHISYIDGDAQVNTGAKDSVFTHAVLNMPVTEGMSIYTPAGGRTEVQFENGATVRLIDDAQVRFTKLVLSDAGGKVDGIQVQHGLVYFNFDKLGKDDQVTVNVGGKDVLLTKASHLRVDADKKNVSLALFKGEASFEAAQKVELKGGEALRFEVANADQYNVAKKIEKSGADNWNKKRDEQNSLLANSQHPGQWPDTYDIQMSSLGAYGQFFSVPGYGMMWQPFNMGMGWNPFMSGVWGFYPGMGYTWISSYPWGWAPYRYGSWNYVSNYGWAWAPGTNFNAFNIGPNIGTAPTGFKAPVTPGLATGVKPASMLVVGHPPNVHSAVLQGRAEVGAAPLATPVHSTPQPRPAQRSQTFARSGAQPNFHAPSSGGMTHSSSSTPTTHHN